MGRTVRGNGVVMCAIMSDLNCCISRAWTGKGEESRYDVKFREEAKAWSMKFPAAPVH